ncbi:hypothetical protein G3M48_001150, partial [Beauveria asiatica]
MQIQLSYPSTKLPNYLDVGQDARAMLFQVACQYQCTLGAIVDRRQQRFLDPAALFTPVNPPNRKRPLPSNASGNASRRPPPTADNAARAAKRSRPSNGGTSSNARSSAAALLRGPNPSVAQNRIGGQEAAAASTTTTTTSRPSLHDVTPSQIQNKPPPARRRSGQTKTAGRRTTQAGGRAVATQRRQQQQQQQQQQQESSPDEQPLSRPRRQVDEAQDEQVGDSEAEDDIEDDDGPPSPEKPYPHVAPFTRRVRQSTIETKWSPLGRGSHKALTSILQLAQRPVLQRLTSSSSSSSASASRRAAPTEAALRLITKRVLDKIRGVPARGLAPLPFPPASLPTRTQRGRPRGGRAEQDGGRETELNFESVLDAKQTLERQLDPVLHAVDLLGAEARRLEEELEQDYEKLRLLEAEARTRARENKNLLKKAHVLAPQGGGGGGGGGGGENGEEEGSKTFANTEGAAVNPFQIMDDDDDDEMRDMVAALGDHVDRIQANAAQTAGVGDQIQRTRAALQAVLARKLGAQT